MISFTHEQLHDLSMMLADLAETLGQDGKYMLSSERIAELQRKYGERPLFMMGTEGEDEGLPFVYVIPTGQGPDAIRGQLLRMGVDEVTADAVGAQVRAADTQLAALDQARKDGRN